MTTIKGYLIEREGRSLFMRDVQDWAMEDPEYKVTPLIAKPVADVYPQFMADDTQERIQLMEELFDLEEKEIHILKIKLEDAVELIELIHEFSSKEIDGILEAKGVLKLISEACGKWLRPKE